MINIYFLLWGLQNLYIITIQNTFDTSIAAFKRSLIVSELGRS